MTAITIASVTELMERSAAHAAAFVTDGLLSIDSPEFIQALCADWMRKTEALDVATNTIQGLRHIHDGNPSLAMADTPPLDYARHMLGEVRLTCKDAIGQIAYILEPTDAPAIPSEDKHHEP